jgi:hypothetical protein
VNQKVHDLTEPTTPDQIVQRAMFATHLTIITDPASRLVKKISIGMMLWKSDLLANLALI